MATLAQLTTAYATITRTQPNAAQTLILTDLATRSTNGNITDAQAYAYVTSQAQSTTSVAALSYQFFTGKTPTAAGFDYLVNSTTNTSDLNDAYYQAFNLENRYINFSINLGVNGEGRTAFSSTYGALSFADTVRVAYEKIIGTAQAQAAGINVQASIDNIIGRQAYFTALAANQPAADRELAAKAAVVGYILAEATKANVGVYVQALNNFYADAVDGTANFNVDLTTSYGTGAGGPGDPGIPGGVTIAYAAGNNIGLNVADLAFRSTAANDTVNAAGQTATGVSIDLGGGNDTWVGGTLAGTAGGAATTVALGAGADVFGTSTAPVAVTQGTTTGTITIDGGAGTDTARLSFAADVAYTAGTGNPNILITGVENLFLAASAAGVDIDTTGFTGATTITHFDVAAGTQALNLTGLASGQGVASTSASASSFTYATGSTIANVSVGGAAGVTGAITVAGVTGAGSVTNLSGTVNSVVNGFTFSSRSLVVTGGSELALGTLTHSGAAANQAYTIDASALTAATSFTYSTVATGTGSEVIKLGAGNDAVTLNFATAVNTTVTLGAGNDVLTISGGAAPTFTSGAIDKLNSVTDFAKGADKIDVAGAYVNTTGDASYIGLSTLQQYVSAADTLLGTTVGFTKFEFGGSTYIVGSAGAAGTADDFVVQLTGVTGVTAGANSTFDLY